MIGLSDIPDSVNILFQLAMLIETTLGYNLEKDMTTRSLKFVNKCIRLLYLTGTQKKAYILKIITFLIIPF